MSSNYDYESELNNYDTEINNFRNSAMSKWEALQGAENMPKQIATEIGSAVAFEYGKSAVDKFFSTGKKVGEAVKKGAQKVVADGKAALKDGVDVIKPEVDNVAQTVSDGVARTVGGVSDIAGGAQRSIESGARGLAEVAGERLSTAQNLVSNVAERAANAADEVAGRATGMASDVAGRATGMANSAASSASDVTRSGLRYTESVMEDGKAAAQSGISLAESKTGSAWDRMLQRLKAPRVTEQGRIQRATIGNSEFEDGPYSLIDQPGTATVRSSFVRAGGSGGSGSTRLSGLVHDGYGNYLGRTDSAISSAGTELRTISRPLTIDTPDVEAIPRMATGALEETGKAVSTGAADLLDATRAANVVSQQVENISNLAGATRTVAADALESGAQAIQGGTQILQKTGAAVGEAAGSAAETGLETAAEVSDIVGAETFGVGDLLGLGLGLGALAYGIFDKPDSEPTVKLPNYSIPVEGLGL